MTTSPARRRDRPWVSRASLRALGVLLTYGLLFAMETTVYCTVLILVGLVRGADAVPGPWWAHVLAVALVAATVEPSRRWLVRGVDDVLAGHHDPYAAVTAVHLQLAPRNLEPGPLASGPLEGSHLEGGQQPPASLAGTLARALDVPCLHVVVPGDPVEAFGNPLPGTIPVVVPVRFDGEQLGELRAWPRRRGSALPGSDVALLRDLGDQVALGMVASRAARAAQSSRAALVEAREEERRRLRRDLHDGLGPTLASLRMQLGALARLLPENAADASTVVAGLLGDVRSATGDVRRLVYGLRPALLDDLGLLGAVAECAAACAATGVVEVDVQLGDLPLLPAAVEVAAYRIASEALHNVTRHAGAARATVAFAVDADQLRLVVTDDGRGPRGPLVPGVGLSAMRERAEELGGSFEVTPLAPHGLRVAACLPLHGRER